MTTFLSIFLVLVIVNVALLVFSAVGVSKRITNIKKSLPSTKATKIYPLDIFTSDSEYKEAI